MSQTRHGSISVGLVPSHYRSQALGVNGWRRRGRANKVKAPDEAVAWYQKAAAADKLWTKPLLKLAVIARDRGDREAAVGYLEKVVGFDPNSAEAAQAASLLGQLGRVN